MRSLSAREDHCDLWNGHLTDPEEVVPLGRLGDPTPSSSAMAAAHRHDRQLPDYVYDATTPLEETLGPQRRIAEETFESRVNVVESALRRHWPVSDRILNLSTMPDLEVVSQQ